MPILRRLVFTFLTLSTALCLLHPSDAAAYRFNVKVVNDAGEMIWIYAVSFKPKSGARKYCADDESLYVASGSNTIQPKCYASSQKWQRQIRVQFNCGSSTGASRELYFPRGSKKFFARDHAKKNGDKYVVRIKASDCLEAKSFIRSHFSKT